jgi:hypothetical protein
VKGERSAARLVGIDGFVRPHRDTKS